ncbi:MAG: helix-turn-helix domain-containing protein [Pseudomonadota bacterium]
MESIDIGLRLMIIGQLLLVSLVVAYREPRKLAIPLAFLKLSVAAYLIKSSPTLASFFESVATLTYLMAMTAPYWVWMCSYVLFDFDRPHWFWIVFLPVVTVSSCSIVLLFNTEVPALAASSMVASLIAVSHAITAIVRDQLDDLSEPRRRFRVCFVICISLLTAFILVQELTLIGQTTPQVLHFINVILIGIVLMFMSVPMVTNNLAEMPMKSAKPEVGTEPEIDFADQHTYSKLNQAMKNRAYARTGLTIRHLAQELDTPEHQLRQLINQRLGHRNFSAFLNSYRLKEACTRLQDPTQARMPILTIALDAGFASLAPFNRAFKVEMGVTPSEFRKNQKSDQPVVTKLTQRG